MLQMLLRRFQAAAFSTALALGIGLAGMGSAQALVWQESNALQSWLDNNYQLEQNGTTWKVKYTDQVATNTGSTGGHFGMYIGWNWVYDAAGTDTPLNQNNPADASFTAPGVVTLTVSQPGGPIQTIRIGDIWGDHWSGIAWNDPAWPDDTPIATQNDWIVPLFDFGYLAAGASTLYDITLEFAFASPEAFANGQEFYVIAQGLQVVPEPGSLALLGAGLLAVAAVRRRRLR